MAARLVYTSGPEGPGAPCPRCASHPCRCTEAKAPAPSTQSVLVRRERAGRKGRTVTVIAPLILARDDAEALLAELKRRCGAGGTLKPTQTDDGRKAVALELQGDQVATVQEHLRTRGFRVKG